MTNKFPKKKFLKKNVRMVQFCCVKGQPLAINIENAAKKVFAGGNWVNWYNFWQCSFEIYFLYKTCKGHNFIFNLKC